MTPSPRKLSRTRNLTWATALLGITILAGCSDQPVQTPTSPSDVTGPQARSGPPDFLLQQDLGPALAAQRRFGAQLLATPGVVGHGIGMVDGEPGIRVFLQTPNVAGVPARLDNVPVGVEVTGTLVAGDLGDPQTRERPVPNGFSIGHPAITAGTLGAIVSDASGVCYALSNNHVLANSNDANIGDNSLQPGPYDGGQNPTDAIGTLSAFKPLLFNGPGNDIDAAISLLTSASSVTAATPSYAYGAPGTQPRTATLGLVLEKFGRTTGFTSGTVQEVNVTANICYECSGPFCMRCKSYATFTGQFATTDMSDGGDSGSLMVDGNQDPVGLLFAGSSTRTIANPITNVLNYFGVTIQPNTGSCTNSGGTVNTPPDVTITAPNDGSAFDEGTSITFQATAGDSEDGNLTQSISWTSDLDGPLGSGGSITTALSVNTHTITASATDGGGLSGDDQITVTVNALGGGGFALTAVAYKVRGFQTVDLTWSGASSADVDVFRDGGLIATAPNGGTHTDNIGVRGGGSYAYQVCEAGTRTCSNTATVEF